jgi:hypothetical protein
MSTATLNGIYYGEKQCTSVQTGIWEKLPGVSGQWIIDSSRLCCKKWETAINFKLVTSAFIPNHQFCCPLLFTWLPNTGLDYRVALDKSCFIKQQ